MNRPFWLFRTSASSDNCETIEPLLSLAADGMASPEETRRLDAHLPGCDGCRAALSWMQATRATLASRPVAVPPPDLHSRIALAIALSSRPVAVPPPDLHSRIALAIAASSAAPASLRPARVFSLRTAYAAAASVTVLGIALSYPLWHAPGAVAVKHSARPAVVASAPAVKAPAVPKIIKRTAKRPLVASNATKPLTVKHTIIAHKTPLIAVMPPEHTASSVVPTKLPAVPQVVKAPVHHAPLSPQIASRTIAPPEKHSIEKHAPLPVARKIAPKPLEGPRVAKIIKEPAKIPLEIRTPSLTPDTPPVRTASAQTAPSKSDYGMGYLRARLQAQNAIHVPVSITTRDLSHGATSLIHTVGDDEHTAFISAVHGNQ